MRTTARLLALAVALSAPACFISGAGEDEMTCDPAPVLAAGVTLALSCAETVRYEGEVYTVSCAPIHPSRLGEVFEHGGGETDYRGARAVRGLETDRFFLLMGRKCDTAKRHVAFADDVTRKEFRLAESPLGDRPGKRD
jgi:hypothetical protein